MKPPRGNGWDFPSGRQPPIPSQKPAARGELGCFWVATKPCFWICPAVWTLEVMRRGHHPQHWQLWARYLIIHPFRPARTNGCHLFPCLSLQGSPALSSITGSSGPLHSLLRGKPLLMTLLVERAVLSLGHPLLTPWSHHSLQRSRRPKEPTRPPSERANLGWCLGNLWKRAWGLGGPQLSPSTGHLQVSPGLKCFTCVPGRPHTVSPPVLFRHWLINDESKFLGLLVNSPCNRTAGSPIQECGDGEDGVDLWGQGCSCFQKQYFVNVFLNFLFWNALKLPPWLLNTVPSKETGLGREK